MLVVSHDERTQDAYVYALRRQRVAALGVEGCGTALLVARQIRLWGVLLDIVDEDGWDACRLLRGLLRPGVRLIALTAHVAPDRTFRRLAREIGCAAFVAKDTPPELLPDTLDRVALGEPWVECVLEHR